MADRRPDLRLVDPAPRWPAWLEHSVMPYVRDPALRPVLVAVLGHVSIALAPLLLVVWRTGSTAAGVAAVGIAIASIAAIGLELARFRRPGGVTVALVATWGAAVLIAWIAERTGFI